MTHLVLHELFVTNLLLFEHQQNKTKNCSLAHSFLEPMALLNTAVVEGRMSLKEGCRKPVLGVCE